MIQWLKSHLRGNRTQVTLKSARFSSDRSRKMLEVDDHFWEIFHGELPMIVTIFIYNSIRTHDGSIGKMGHIYPAIYYKQKNQLHSCIGKYTYNRPMDAMGKPSIIMVAWCHSSLDWIGPKKLCKKPERRRGIVNIYIAGGGHGG